MKRLFFALDISEHDKAVIAKWRAQHLTSSYQQSKTIPQDNFHITLAFLGLVDNSQQNRLITNMTQLRQQAELSGSLPLTLNQIGLFKKPQVLYIANTELPKALVTLHAQVNHLAYEEQLPIEERTYLPHISLFRKAKNLAINLSNPSIQIDTSSFSLYQSMPHSNGVQYTPIASWPI